MFNSLRSLAPSTRAPHRCSFYAGQNDPRVPRRESDTIVRALHSGQVPVEYMVAANKGHTVDHRETKIELLSRTSRLLAEALHYTGTP